MIVKQIVTFHNTLLRSKNKMLTIPSTTTLQHYKKKYSCNLEKIAMHKEKLYSEISFSSVQTSRKTDYKQRI
jgi:hypothetical protein